MSYPTIHLIVTIFYDVSFVRPLGTFRFER
jgi:hypothetical protein